MSARTLIALMSIATKSPALARLCPFWRGFEFISSAGPEDSLLFDDAEGVVERKNGAPEGTR